MNKYGSEGPANLCWQVPTANFNIPGGLFLLVPTTTIRLCTMSSDPVDTGETGLPPVVFIREATDAQSLSEEWLTIFITKVGVPADCISFTWRRERPTYYWVTIAFHPLDPGVRDARTDEDGFCLVCTMPCIEASSSRAALQTCAKCTPLDLCDRCKIEVRTGIFKCFMCLSDNPDEWSRVKEEDPIEGFRMSLLELW